MRAYALTESKYIDTTRGYIHSSQAKSWSTVSVGQVFHFLNGETGLEWYRNTLNCSMALF